MLIVAAKPKSSMWLGDEQMEVSYQTWNLDDRRWRDGQVEHVKSNGASTRVLAERGERGAGVNRTVHRNQSFDGKEKRLKNMKSFTQTSLRTRCSPLCSVVVFSLFLCGCAAAKRVPIEIVYQGHTLHLYRIDPRLETNHIFEAYDMGIAPLEVLRPMVVGNTNAVRRLDGYLKSFHYGLQREFDEYNRLSARRRQGDELFRYVIIAPSVEEWGLDRAEEGLLILDARDRVRYRKMIAGNNILPEDEYIAP